MAVTNACQLISIELNIEHGLFLRLKIVLEIDCEVNGKHNADDRKKNFLFLH